MTPLKHIRIKQGLTIYDVAKGADCSAGTISRVESGKHGISPDLAERLSKFFDGTITEEEIIYPDRFAIEKKK